MSDEGANILCYILGPNLPFKIYIPDAILDNIIRFYHLMLNHVSMTTRL